MTGGRMGWGAQRDPPLGNADSVSCVSYGTCLSPICWVGVWPCVQPPAVRLRGPSVCGMRGPLCWSLASGRSDPGHDLMRCVTWSVLPSLCLPSAQHRGAAARWDQIPFLPEGL